MRWPSALPAPTSLLCLILPTLVAGQLAAGDLAYVTNQSSSDLSVIDLATRTERARIPVPGQPAGVVAHGGMVWVVAPETKTIRRLSPEGSIQAETTLEGGPTGVALDATRNRLFISDWFNARIWVRDATTLAPVTELQTGAAPAGLEISPDGRWLAAAARDAHEVALFDAQSLAPHATVPTGTRPYGLGFDPSGRLWVGNVGTNDVTVIDPEAPSAITTLPVGERPYGIAFAQGRAFVTNQYADTVSVIDLASLAPVATLDVGEYPEGIDVAEGGAQVVVAGWFSNTLTVIDAQSLETLAEIPTGDGPRAFGRFVMEDK
ncbi:YncE family protein [Oceanicola sp. D3]|uniref:YVTN family beta-propeller repeat protein n=1 Tax=Oceanicola sp. D3 TaxID=2587163 RepID=UPI001122B609|nr:beta-propeller fold lactonase family protein [Oceanicola sp. D3]QDC09856.1 YncE family protein [Oceanicola sp. D3]